jgi:hypothetical protein
MGKDMEASLCGLIGIVYTPEVSRRGRLAIIREN